LPQGYHQNTKVDPSPSKPSASMVDTASSSAHLCVEKDDKAKSQFGFSRE